MRRGLQIVVALMAVFLLVRPFDCFARPQSEKKARDCCKKGNCKPSNSDDCCKAAVADADRVLTAKAPDHTVPVLHAVITEIWRSPSRLLLLASLRCELYAPPGSPPGGRFNLPLLI